MGMYYETLDHVPGSILVHVVKGRQCSVYTVLVPHIHAGTSIAEMESETDSRPR